MRKFLALLAGGIIGVMGQANAQAILDLPAATLPLSGNEATVLVQGGATVQAPVYAFPSAPFPGGVWPGSLGGTGVANTGKTITLGGALTTAGALSTSGTGATLLEFPNAISIFAFPATSATLMSSKADNATLPDARTNLGLGTAAAVQFGTLALSGAPLTAPSFLDTPGSLATGYAFPVKRWGMYLGSVGSPITTAGPAVSLSTTGNVPKSECSNNAAAVGCNPTLMVSTKGLATQEMVTSGITTFATGSSTVAGSDIQALNAISTVDGSGVGIAAGAFIFGARYTATGEAEGAEISAGNYTGTNCALGYVFSGQCDGIFLASRGTGPTSQLSAALHVGTDHNSLWREGVSFNPNSVLDTTILDQSSSTESIVIAGGHTKAIRTLPGAGSIEFGDQMTVAGRLTLNTANGAILNEPGGSQAAWLFMNNNTPKWTLGKQGDDSFFLFDAANSVSPVVVSTAGNMQLGEAGKLVQFLGDIWTNGRKLLSATAPFIAGGGCTTGSGQSIPVANGTAAFIILLGGATCGSTITLTMPPAASDWVCDAHNITTPATQVVEQTGAVSTTAVVFTNYSRTLGTATNFTGAETIRVKCSAY